MLAQTGKMCHSVLTMLNEGQQAPDFSLLDQDGHKHSLGEYKGKWVLLYFYPKDDTPGCTAEACALRDNYADLTKLSVVIGVSADSVESHKKFVDKYHLPFTLLADPEKKVIKEYGANGIPFNKRISYLIDPQGKIVKVYPKVDPQQHAAEISKDLQALA